MDKKTFINELKTALSVLQEDELNDIVNEYEQHIDMKMKNGLSEDEAIADFGSIGELTADILEAYHVRADYADKKSEKKSFWGTNGNAGKEILHQTGKTCKAAGEKAAHGLRGLGGWILGIFLFWKQAAADALKKIAGWHQDRRQKFLERRATASAPTVPSAAAENHAADKSVREKKLPGTGLGQGIQRLLRSGIHLINTCFHLCLRLALWCVRMAWNICWIGFALFCAGFGLLALFGFGLLTVLWLQSYPLAGVTVGCFGLVCCCFSAAGFSLSLLWRKKRPDMEASPCGREMEEGQHA